MRTVSVDLASHISQDTTTLCVLWKITRQDTVVQGFTSHTSALQYNDGEDDILYQASTGICPTNTQESIGSGVDNMTIVGLLSSPDIATADLLNGVYDFARVKIMLLNYTDISQEHITLLKGVVGNIVKKSAVFEVEIRSLSQIINQQVGMVSTPTCMADFCDSKCKLNAATYTHSATISGVTSRRIFFCSSLSGLTANQLSFGKCTFTYGANQGISAIVKYNDNVGGNGRIELQTEMPFDIEDGDSVSILDGCDKKLATCISRSNAVNFRGFPHVPGVDAVLRIISA